MKSHFLFLFSLLFVLSCSAPEEPTFQKLQNVKFDSFGLSPLSITLNADAIFHNPNSLGAKITEMDFDVYINNKKSTHIRQDLQSTMPAKSDFALPIKYKIPLKEVFKGIKLQEIMKMRSLKYKMDGHLKIGLGSVEVKVPVTYEGEEKIQL